MKNIRKELKRCLILILFIAIGFSIKFGYDTLADNENIWIEVNGEKVNGELIMKTRALNLMLRSEGVVYDSADYKIKWSIPIQEHLDVIEFQDTTDNVYQGSGLTNCVIKAKKPGTAQVQLEIIDATGGASAGGIVASVTCNIKVVYGIDTEGEPLHFQYVMPEDTERSLVMYTDDEKQLKLSIGDSATDVAWKSDNKDVVTVDGGKVKAVGSGVATVSVESADGSDKLKVYVIPKLSSTGAEGSFGIKQTYQLESGDLLYTDTLFEDNQTLTLKDKIVWAIYKYDSDNNRILIEDSLGNASSDLIELTPTGSGASVPKHLSVNAKAGIYYIDFYPRGSYYNDSKKNTELANTIKVIIASDIKSSQEIALNVGDQFSIPNAINITEEEFTSLFTVQQTSGNTGIISYNTSNGMITATEADAGYVTMKVTPRSSANIEDLKALYGGAEPTSFDIIIRVVDELILDQSSVRLVVGEERQLSPTIPNFEGTYEWSSSNEQYVTVTDNGLIKGIKATQEDVTVTVSLKLKNGTIKKATCKVKVVETVNSIKLDQTDVQMELGSKTTITATFDPDRGEAPINWMSTDSSVASIKVSGDNKSIVVTANKAGTATIVAMNKDNYVTAFCKITVLSPIRSLTLSDNQLTVKLSQEIVRLKYSYTPTDATSTDIEWASSDTKIATVDNNGLVTLKKAGVVIITAKPTYNISPPIMAQCILTIQQSAEGLKLSPTEVTLNTGEKKQIEYTFQPENAVSSITNWTSYNEKIAKVSNDGVVTAVAPGETYIVARSEEGYVATCYVKVLQAATSITMTNSNITMYTGETTILGYTLKPGTSTSNVTFELIDSTGTKSKLVKVSKNGEVTALAAGEVDVLVKTEEGLTASCHITILQTANAITISPSETSIQVGEEKKINATLTPANATSTITWISFDEKIVKVSSDGTITGVSVGETYIIAKTQEGHITKCLIKVWKPPTSIALPSTIEVSVGSSTAITPILTPANATTTFTWTSFNEKIATVSSDGIIKGISVGETYIFVRTKEGLTAQCLVKVFQSSSGFTFDEDEIIMELGNKKKIGYTCIPANATTTIKWLSVNESIAKVSTDGTVEAVGIGTTVIVGTDEKGNQDTCKITIIQKPTDITISSSVRVKVGGTLKLGVTFTPENTTEKKLKWESANSKIATVSNGVISGMKAGYTLVTVTTSNNIIKNVFVEVYEETDVTGITVTPTQKTIVQGNTYQLKATVLPSSAANKKVKWTSSNESVVKVYSTGKIKGIKAGKAVITCTSLSNSKKATCVVTVKKRTLSVKLNRSKLSLAQGKKFKLKATIKSNYGASPKLSWSSSNNSVAEVNQSGVVIAKKKGTCKIKVRTTDGSNKSASCSITVTRKASNITLNKTYLKIFEGKKTKLKATIRPSNANNKSVKWTSSDNEIAMVTYNGTITALTQGRVIITATTTDGSNKSASCVIDVQKTVPVTGISLTSKEMVLVKGTSDYLPVTIQPANNTNKISYSSDNVRVATVTATGKVVAKAPGQTTITVRSSNGVQTSVTVTVVGLNKVSLNMEQYDTETIWLEEITSGVKWSSLNPRIASVSNGVITAKRLGTTSIVAYYKGVRLYCTVTVSKIK